MRLSNFLGLLVLLVVSPALATLAVAQTPSGVQAEPTTRNSNIVSWAEGSYLYRTTVEKKARGTEKFRLDVHPDGSRSIIMWVDIFERSLQYTVLSRVSADFRPLESFASYRTAAGFKGSTHITINGNILKAASNGPLGRFTQEIDVPQRFSIGAHPVAADSWHIFAGDAKSDTPQIGKSYRLDGTDPARPALGALVDQEFRNLGKARISVPAGTFDTVHYQLGVSEIWIADGQLVVKESNPARGFEYVLQELRTGR